MLMQLVYLIYSPGGLYNMLLHEITFFLIVFISIRQVAIIFINGDYAAALSI